MLGVVSGRRRQGKSYLLEALTSASGGLYFPALEETETVSLRSFAAALVRQGVAVDRPFQDWTDAIRLLLSSAGDRPLTVVIDEFPFLVKSSPSLPSVIQRELGPGGAGRDSTARLLLCGSAMSVMGGLLAGQAPLRGRASLEMLIRPFGYRDAARFWGADDPKLAVLLHSVVGGTPAYRRELVAFDAPVGPDDFDSWVTRTVLNPQSPLFREARYLLAEETEIRDPALYHSVLGAIAAGHRTNGGIASFIGRKSADLTHPLNVLEDCSLITRSPDVFRRGRWTYEVTEPLINFYEAVMRPEWFRLEAGQSAEVWREKEHDFFRGVVGPHFESVCRSFARERGTELFGTPVGEVGSGVINDSSSRSRIQLDVVVFAPAAPGEGRKIVSLGEVKWGEVMGTRHVDRLRRARDLLASGYDVEDCVLACYSAAGFTGELRSAAEPGVTLVSLEDIYRLRAVGEDLVGEAVVEGRLGGEHAVPVGVGA
ncbi:MAG: ATP-binding protein [Nocardiopsaceae bacterium]|nr:ATP-binding protein [Nocardiopsaceae bacterium]